MPKKPSKEIIQTNCWSTLYALFEQSRDPSAPYNVFNAYSLGNFFNNDQVSTRLHSWMGRNSNDIEAEKNRNNFLQPGDYIVIGQGDVGRITYVKHVALFVDNDLYYEKPGPDNRYTARLMTYSKLKETYPGDIFQARRLKNTPLPTAKSFLVGSSSNFGLLPVFLERDAGTGRAVLPTNLFKKIYP